jgi:sugar lactone lactonase YvrE
VSDVEVLSSGFALGESPRWHDDRLWFCDWGAQQVVAVDLEGHREVVAQLPSFPFCIDYLPDGRLLIISARDGRLVRREPDGSLVTHADLGELSNKPWNDITVDGHGDAYVGNVGFEFPGGEFAPGTLALVRPDGSAREVADGLAFPNGMVVARDGGTLIVAESYASRLTAFEIAADGALSGRRVWADLGEGAAPDGICLDVEGAVWYADVPNKHCVRVREGGEVLQTVQLDRGCFACALGGPDATTLFVIAAQFPPDFANLTGQVLAVHVSVPGASVGR